MAPAAAAEQYASSVGLSSTKAPIRLPKDLTAPGRLAVHSRTSLQAMHPLRAAAVEAVAAPQPSALVTQRAPDVEDVPSSARPVDLPPDLRKMVSL